MSSAPSFLTLAEENDRLIVVNSFSKAWSMTGWRLGWMVVPPSIAGRSRGAARIQRILRF